LHKVPTVHIPNVFLPMSDGRAQVEVQGRTLRQVFANLEAAYPALKDQIVQDGDIRPGLAIAVDDEIASEGLVQVIEPNADVRILPAVGGGAVREQHATSNKEQDTHEGTLLPVARCLLPIY
jgi:hypothetical protein